MSYFLLPKNNNIINLKISFSLETQLSSITVNTLHYYYILENAIQIIIHSNAVSQVSSFNCDDVIHLSNPYEYLYQNCPGYNSPISKLKTKSILLYDLIEINSLLDLFGSLKKPNLHILNISENFEDFKDYFNYYADAIKDPGCHDIASYCSIEQDTPEIKQKFDFVYFEENVSFKSKLGCHFKNIIKILFTVFNNLDIGGNCLIKVNNVFYKPLIDLLYLFSSIFDKVYIIKPNTSNVVTFEKYIFCKYFSGTNFNIVYNDWKYYIDNNNENMSLLNSLIETETPCYFLNKIQDLNSVLVQQQLETMEQMINIFKTKNIEDKLEVLKKINIQKSCVWCEKFNVPHHKFSEKINMFLPLSKEEQTNKNDLNNIIADSSSEVNSEVNSDTTYNKQDNLDSDENISIFDEEDLQLS